MIDSTFITLIAFGFGFMLGFPKSRNWLQKTIKQAIANKKKNEAKKLPLPLSSPKKEEEQK